MASLTLTIPDDQVNRVADALGWTANDGTRGTYIRNLIIADIKARVRQYELRVALVATQATEDAKPEVPVT
jgi:hypothetical protein